MDVGSLPVDIFLVISCALCDVICPKDDVNVAVFGLILTAFSGEGAPGVALAKNQLSRQTAASKKWFKEQLKHCRRSSSVQIDSAAKRIEQRTAVGAARRWVELNGSKVNT